MPGFILFSITIINLFPFMLSFLFFHCKLYKASNTPSKGWWSNHLYFIKILYPHHAAPNTESHSIDAQGQLNHGWLYFGFNI